MLVAPELVAAAASDLAGLGSTINEAHAAAAASTTAIAPAAGDQVSAAVAALFSAHSQEFQALSARAREFHAQLVRALIGAAGAYGATEAASAAALAPAAKSDPFGALGKFLTTVVKETIGRPKLLEPVKELDALMPKHKSLFDLIPKIPQDISGARSRAVAQLTAQEQRVQKVLNNGVKLLARNGTAFYTDGQTLVSRVQNATGGLTTSIETGQFFKGARLIGLDEETLRSLHGKELHVFARGEGLAQSYFEKVGNEVYQIDTDIEGRIIRRFQSTAAIFNRWVSMTGGQAPWKLLR